MKEQPLFSRALGGTVRLLFDRTVLLLAAIFVASVGMTLRFVYSHQQNLIRIRALQQAAAHSQALTELRTLYTATVVTTAQQYGLRVVHDFDTIAGAIPLPATLSMMLGDSITSKGAGGRIRLYSPHPFPWKESTGGLRDDFDRDAWSFLRIARDTFHWSIEDIDGRSMLRYATADIMRPSCVNCHNNHVDSPKRDWEVGDVRGILEVDVPLDAALGQLRWGVGGMTAFLALMTGLGLSGLVLVVRRSAFTNWMSRMSQGMAVS